MNGSTRQLSQLNLSCPTGKVLTEFGLKRDPSTPKMYYEYSCASQLTSEIKSGFSNLVTVNDNFQMSTLEVSQRNDYVLLSTGPKLYCRT